jgi:hypothetical protein
LFHWFIYFKKKKFPMELPQNFSFPGYISVPSLSHPIYGSDIFFFCLEEYDSVANSGKSPHSRYFRFSPDNRDFLNETFPTFLPSTFEEGTDPPAIIRSQLRVSDLSQVSCSSGASTVPIGVTSIVDTLDSAHPTWRANIQCAARDKILPVLLHPHFDSTKFEELLQSKILLSTLPFTSAQSRAAINFIFQACFTMEPTSPSVRFSPSVDYASDSDIYSIQSEDSMDSGEKGRVLDPRLSVHRRAVRKELQSPHCSSNMKETLTKFLSTPASTPAPTPDHGISSIASDHPLRLASHSFCLP